MPGGYMGMKKAKLVDQYSEQARAEDKKGGIFTGELFNGSYFYSFGLRETILCK